MFLTSCSCSFSRRLRCASSCGLGHLEHQVELRGGAHGGGLGRGLGLELQLHVGQLLDGRGVTLRDFAGTQLRE